MDQCLLDHGRRLKMGLLAAFLVGTALWAGSPAAAINDMTVTPTTGLTDGHEVTVTLSDWPLDLPQIDLVQCKPSPQSTADCDLASTQISVPMDFGSATATFTVRVLNEDVKCNPTTPCALVAVTDAVNFLTNIREVGISFADSGPTTTTTSAPTTTTSPPTTTTTGPTTTTTGPTTTTTGPTTTTTGPTSTTTTATTSPTTTTTAPPVTTTTTGPAPKGGRYLALGDSIPYGLGLANPTVTPQTRWGSTDVLPADQGPAAQAYPSLLASDVGLPFRLRTTRCELGAPPGQPPYDQLAVSGATAARHRFTRADPNCPGPLHHKTVLTEQLRAARVEAHPPSLVTIQAGAGDARLGPCLAAILRLSLPRDLPTSPLLGPARRSCLRHRHGGYEVTSTAADDVDNLGDDLEEIITASGAAATRRSTCSATTRPSRRPGPR